MVPRIPVNGIFNVIVTILITGKEAKDVMVMMNENLPTPEIRDDIKTKCEPKNIEEGKRRTREFTLNVKTVLPLTVFYSYTFGS